MSNDMQSSDLAEATAVMNHESSRLPVTHSLSLAYLFSLLICLLTAVASIAGLLYADNIYPSEDLHQSFAANDVVNLFIGLPILLGSMWLAWRSKLIGLLFWPGALFYGFYNYLVYLIGTPLNVMFPVYLTIVSLSIYTTIALVAMVEGKVVKERLNGRVPERLAGGILAAFGVLFAVRAIVVILGALVNETHLAGPELAVLVADFLIAPALMIGGLLLWRRRSLGYVGGTGLLFQVSMLFIGLIAFLIIQPLVSDTQFVMTDIIVIFVMGLICFIPFGLFVRGVIKA